MSRSTQSPAIEQIVSGDDGAALAAARRKRKRRTVGVMGFVAALLIGGLAFVGYNVYDIHAGSRAKVEYDEAYTAYLASVSQLDESLKSVSDTINICRGSVADIAVCENLERQNASGLELSNSKVDKADIHNKTTDEIRAQTRSLREAQAVIDQARDALLAALDPVAQSQVDKVKMELDAAIEAAEKAISEAQKVVDENKDQVQDERVRQSAIEAIKAVRTQIDGARAVTGTGTAAYTAAMQSLNQAVEDLATKVQAVEYSHAVWEQEKREAEARASASASAAAEEERLKQEEAERERQEEQKKKDDKDSKDKADKEERAAAQGQRNSQGQDG